MTGETTMERMRDAIVVGGGPSGLHCARRLADRGLEALVLEKKSSIGERVICTGIVGETAFAEFDLDRTTVLEDLQKMTMISPGLDFLDYEHPSPFARVVDRGGFDHSLGERARAAGAEILTGREAVDIVIGPDSVKVTSQDGEKRRETHLARTVVLATGINFRPARKIGLGSPKGFLYGAQAEFDVDIPPKPTIFVGRSVAAGAFAWLIPAGKGRARVGMMTGRDPRENLERLILRLYPGQADTLNKDSVQVKAIAQGIIPRSFGDRVLAVGEAAGQVKTTTGGGIYFGLLCAEIAAGVLDSGIRLNRVSASDLEPYETEWKKAIHKEIVVGLALRHLFARMNDATIERLFRLAKRDGVIPQLRGQADFDRHCDLVLSMMKRAPFFQILKPRLDSRPILRMSS